MRFVRQVHAIGALPDIRVNVLERELLVESLTAAHNRDLGIDASR